MRDEVREIRDIGRGYLVRMLDSVITGMAGQGRRPWFATHAQIKDLAGASTSGSPRSVPHQTGSRLP